MHAEQIKLFGGASGDVNDAVLEAITYQAPATTSDGRLVHKSFAEIAAAYVFYIVEYQPFATANDRLAFSAAITFLRWNNFMLTAGQDEILELIDKVSQKKLGKKEIASFFSGHTMKIGTQSC